MTNTAAPYERLRKVVAATDYSDLSLLAVNGAIEDAFRHRGLLHVVHVEELPQQHSDKDQHEPLDRLRRYVAPRLLAHAELHGLSAPMTALCHLRTGDPAREIVQAAADLEADVIYLSTHGRTGARRMLLGSVAENVVRHASSPVMVMRPNPKDTDGWADESEAESLVVAPPCPKCVAIRRQTGGRVFWCEEHQDSLGRRHKYHHVPRTGQQRVNMPLVFPQDDLGG